MLEWAPRKVVESLSLEVFNNICLAVVLRNAV